MKKKHLVFLVNFVFLLVLTACLPDKSTPLDAEPEDGVSVDQRVLDWIEDNAVSLNPSLAPDDFSDMDALGAVVGDHYLVTLGAPVFGSREILDLKQRIVRYLISEMGFNTVALRVSWTRAVALNEYVQVGTGDPEAIVADLRMWQWQMPQILELAEWMRQHNLNNPGAVPLSFYGYDMCDSTDIRPMIDSILEYIGRVDPDYLSTAENHYACFYGYIDSLNAYRDLAAGFQLQCRQGLSIVESYAGNQADRYIPASSEKEYAEMIQAMNLIKEFEIIVRQNSIFVNNNFYEPAGYYLNENVHWLRSRIGYDKIKLILWGHNEDLAVDLGNLNAFSTILWSENDNDMTNIGFGFYEGQYRAIENGTAGPPTVFSAAPAPEEAYEYRFRSSGIPSFLIDLSCFECQSDVTTWMFGPREFRTIGAYANFNPSLGISETSLPELFDVMIYVETLSAAAPLF